VTAASVSLLQMVTGRFLQIRFFAGPSGKLFVRQYHEPGIVDGVTSSLAGTVMTANRRSHVSSRDCANFPIYRRRRKAGRPAGRSRVAYHRRRSEKSCSWDEATPLAVSVTEPPVLGDRFGARVVGAKSGRFSQRGIRPQRRSPSTGCPVSGSHR
jgi:hypothetical protein